MYKKLFLQKNQLQNGRSILSQAERSISRIIFKLSKIFVNKKCK